MKRLIIVYKAQGPTSGSAMTFIGDAATIVQNALSAAEDKGALSAHFTIEDEEYRLRTDKYLYWVVSDE